MDQVVLIIEICSGVSLTSFGVKMCSFLCRRTIFPILKLYFFLLHTEYFKQIEELFKTCSVLLKWKMTNEIYNVFLNFLKYFTFETF